MKKINYCQVARAGWSDKNRQSRDDQTKAPSILAIKKGPSGPFLVERGD
jgi:hypothetical protein